MEELERKTYLQPEAWALCFYSRNLEPRKAETESTARNSGRIGAISEVALGQLRRLSDFGSSPKLSRAEKA